MKQALIGTLIIVAMIAGLAGFPLVPHLIGEKAHVMEVNDPSVSPWFLAEEQSDVVLIYFGYVGCMSVCAPALSELAPLYEEIHRRFPSGALYFVNLNPAKPPQSVEPFAKAFHADFHGIYASAEQTERLERDFNLAIADDSEEIAHSSNLYLMVRERGGYVLKRIYTTHPFPKKRILDDIKRLVA